MNRGGNYCFRAEFKKKLIFLTGITFAQLVETRLKFNVVLTPEGHKKIAQRTHNISLFLVYPTYPPVVRCFHWIDIHDGLKKERKKVDSLMPGNYLVCSSARFGST